MKKIKPLLTTSLFMVPTLITSAQQFSKADQAVIANYPITAKSVNQFEKGSGAAKAAEPKYASSNKSITDFLPHFRQLPHFLSRFVFCHLRNYKLIQCLYNV